MDATPVRIGDVSGPKAAVTDNNFASWDGVSGRLIKDSGSNASSFDTAGAAAAVQGNLYTHVGLTGTDVHGLGTMSTETAADYGKLADANSWADTQTIQRIVIPAKTSIADPANVIGGTVEHDSSGISQIDIYSDETFTYSHNVRLIHSGLVNQNNAWTHLYGPKGTGTSDQAHMLKLDYVGASETGTLTLLERGGATKAQWSWGSDANTWYHFGAGSRIGAAKLSVAGDIASSGKISTSGTAADSIETAGGVQSGGQAPPNLSQGFNFGRTSTNFVSPLRLGNNSGSGEFYININGTTPTTLGGNARDVWFETFYGGLNASMRLISNGALSTIVLGVGNRSGQELTVKAKGITVLGTTPDSATAAVVNIGNGIVDAGTEYRVAGTKVVGAQGAAIADAAAGSGTATNGGWGFVSEAEFNDFIASFNALKDSHNTLLSRARAHGLIAA